MNPTPAPRQLTTATFEAGRLPHRLETLRDNLRFILDKLPDQTIGDALKARIRDVVEAIDEPLAEARSRVDALIRRLTEPPTSFTPAELTAAVTAIQKSLGGVWRIDPLVRDLQALADDDRERFGLVMVLVTESAGNIMNALQPLLDILDRLPDLPRTLAPPTTPPAPPEDGAQVKPNPDAIVTGVFRCCLCGEIAGISEISDEWETDRAYLNIEATRPASTTASYRKRVALSSR